MFIILALFGWFAWWKSPKEDDNVLYFHISQTDEIKLALKRGNTIARLMAEKDRRPAEHTKKFLDNEMQSVKNGDIDDLLKKELRSNGS